MAATDPVVQSPPSCVQGWPPAKPSAAIGRGELPIIEITEEKPMLKFVLTVAFAGLFATRALAADCTKMADDKKLAGAARASFVKKCEKDAGMAASPVCEKSAADKKLAGAAKTSHLRKCMANAAAKKP
jgi:hypothetical protein